MPAGILRASMANWTSLSVKYLKRGPKCKESFDNQEKLFWDVPSLGTKPAPKAGGCASGTNVHWCCCLVEWCWLPPWLLLTAAECSNQSAADDWLMQTAADFRGLLLMPTVATCWQLMLTVAGSNWPTVDDWLWPTIIAETVTSREASASQKKLAFSCCLHVPLSIFLLSLIKNIWEKESPSTVFISLFIKRNHFKYKYGRKANIFSDHTNCFLVTIFYNLDWMNFVN